MKHAIHKLGQGLRQYVGPGHSGSEGQTLVEYSLLLAFITTMIVAIGVFVGGANGLIGDIASSLAEALG